MAQRCGVFALRGGGRDRLGERPHGIEEAHFGRRLQSLHVDFAARRALRFAQDIRDAFVGGGETRRLRQLEKGGKRLQALRKIQRRARLGRKHRIKHLCRDGGACGCSARAFEIVRTQALQHVVVHFIGGARRRHRLQRHGALDQAAQIQIELPLDEDAQYANRGSAQPKWIAGAARLSGRSQNSRRGCRVCRRSTAQLRHGSAAAHRPRCAAGSARGWRRPLPAAPGRGVRSSGP